ncbi:sn-glycerol-3-phosphate ABC transporter ATP-binding protein UgpC [Devosia sp. BK]|uniref:ABC transporter ATP-binding protein n=1 Tax=unclassified Devosia TaxID=196773 RepID=UPI0007138067|nr:MULTISPECIES: sn-glycerol-3-phosphate ABC transporter ATP-binding protein UgpC [unclassified Devosia]KQN72692.1 ABC transporter ATP-binding protein [Devosia sp. Leaf64]KQT51541.1 ABC transporter ATP-binding protein [Devosia sp. Leaf420]MDV3251064.1 sn-glycerol-3-phosphate ABC transporter ATP-binding protein UgpC [Devosia sp. BK]
MQPSVSIKDLSLNFGNVKVLERLNLDIAQGEFIVLLGPSGCGKSTLLNCIAGLLDVSDGQIFINGKNVTWEEPKDRGIGMVFQSYALYPQMTVERNLSFGLRVSGMAKDEIARRVARAAEILQIQPLLGRKPANLSGGQRQRVAIGRALVRDVDVFLFDEPLSNLDAKLRSDLRVEIKRLHARLKNTMIYVTHDQIEALTLADRIAIMKNGVIQQLADPHTIYNKPVNLYVAGFIGSPSMNFINGSLDGATFTADDGTKIPVGAYDFAAQRGAATKAVLGVRPEHILLGDAAQGMPFQTQAEIEIVEPMGSETLAWTKVAGIPVTFRCSSDIPLHAGDKVTVGFDIARGSLFDAQSESRL